MHTSWGDLELFLAVAETGSLTGAARRLTVTQPTISRQLADLEARLGEPLFVRTVEGAHLTAFGERFLEPTRRMADSARDVELVVSGVETKARGVVRITAPPGVAAELVVPFALRLRDELPEVRLEVVATVSYVDLVRREADLALRVQRLDRASSQRDLVAVASIEHGVAAYATPEYVARLPRGYGIADIGWIGWAPPLEHVPPNPQLAAMIPGFRPIFASDDYLVQLRAAEAGVGAILLGRLRSRDARPTTLAEMKLDLGKVTSSLHLVAARSSLAIPRVRAVADLLARDLQAAPRGARRRE
jgi:DNA-binding transcriptional LysR family regulator